MCVYMCVEERDVCMPVFVRMHESEREKQKKSHRALCMCVYVCVSVSVCSRCLSLCMIVPRGHWPSVYIYLPWAVPL
jgi:hypothetical protein